MTEEPTKDSFLAFADEASDAPTMELCEEADVILLGLSGVGKSAICQELGKRGIKAANMTNLFAARTDELKQLISNGKPVIGLLCHYQEIVKRRGQTERWNTRSRQEYGLNYGESYRGYFEGIEVKEEFRAQNKLYRDIKCRTMNVTIETPSSAAEKIINFYLQPMAPPPKSKQGPDNAPTPV